MLSRSKISASHRSLASLASPEQPGVRGLRRHDVRRGGVGRNWLHRKTGVWHWASLGAAGWGCWGWVNWNLEMLLLCWKNFQQLDWLGFIDTYSYLIHVYWFFFHVYWEEVSRPTWGDDTTTRWRHGKDRGLYLRVPPLGYWSHSHGKVRNSMIYKWVISHSYVKLLEAIDPKLTIWKRWTLGGSKT